MKISSHQKYILKRLLIVIQGIGLLIIFCFWLIEKYNFEKLDDKTKKIELNVSLYNSSLTRASILLASYTNFDQQYMENNSDTIALIYAMRMMREYNREVLKVRNLTVDILYMDTSKYSSEWRSQQYQFAHAENNTVRVLNKFSDLNLLRLHSTQKLRFITDTLGKWIPDINKHWINTITLTDKAKNNYLLFYIVGSIFLALNFVIRYIIIEEQQ